MGAGLEKTGRTGEMDGKSPPRRRNGEASAPKHHRVRLLVTPIGPLLPKFQAYHTSVRVDDLEYSFSNFGIACHVGQGSHEAFQRGQSPKVVDMGRTVVSPHAMLAELRPHFRPGTYDLLRKNCNSFSDCALYYLVGRRLDDEYRAPEKLGRQWDQCTGIVRNVTGGGYQPNPLADDFQSRKVVTKLANNRFKAGHAADPTFEKRSPQASGTVGWHAFGA